MHPYITCICFMNLLLNFSGKWLGSRQIRCNWATKGAAGNEDKQSSDAKSVVELTNGSSGESNTT
jgi:nucleolysin TIA-1/TIAR